MGGDASTDDATRLMPRLPSLLPPPPPPLLPLARFGSLAHRTCAPAQPAVLGVRLGVLNLPPSFMALTCDISFSRRGGSPVCRRGLCNV